MGCKTKARGVWFLALYGGVVVSVRTSTAAVSQFVVSPPTSLLKKQKNGVVG